jgi:multidrug resistance efflux pump
LILLNVEVTRFDYPSACPRSREAPMPRSPPIEAKLASATFGVGLALALWTFPSASSAQNRSGGAPAQNASSVMRLGVAVSGVVTSIDVSDGAHVNLNQVLLQIDCRPLQFEVQARTAGLAALEAAFQRVRNGPRPDEIAIGQAGVGVARARSEDARDEYDRLSRLTVGMTVTQEQLFHAGREARMAMAQLDDADKRLALLQAGSRWEDIAEAQAKRDEAQALLNEAKADLDQCSVRAPAAGVVKVIANVGQFVSTSIPTTLMELTPDARKQ